MTTASARPVNQATFGALANGVTLMRANFSDHAFERHSHDGFAIGVTTFGIQRFRCKGRQYDSRPGDLVLFNPDDDHDGCRGTADGFRYTMWYVPDDFVASCVAGNRYFSKPHATDRQVADAFQALTANLTQAPGEALRVESLIRAFLGTMLARHGERPQPGSGASRTAAAATLARIRLGMPLADVALECGFADQSHFTRRFKGSVGVTPSAWRSMSGVSRSAAPAP